MSQPYWSWGSDVLECDAPSVDPRVYKDLDELNNIVQQLRNDVAVLHREKGELKKRVLCLEKFINIADAFLKKIGDAEEETHKTKDSGVAEKREESIQNKKGRLQYTPLNLKWDDLAVMRVTLVKFLTNPPQKMDMPIAEGDGGDDVIVRVQQKRGQEKSATLGL
ncbi:hypothetical protein L3X38_036195 [Prunus dulcis]|uniref:Uncharacterized protein n=1 Tax=Prunus dulcis TaxID=3755 RepID=A0AAD4V196_PRUDU|nr:hypothetical protein L3X38_036195 [Prunus dulcis]